MDLPALQIIPFLHGTKLANMDSVSAYSHRGADRPTGEQTILHRVCRAYT